MYLEHSGALREAAGWEDQDYGASSGSVPRRTLVYQRASSTPHLVRDELWLCEHGRLSSSWSSE